MDKTLFTQAKAAYDAGDFTEAYNGFNLCLQGPEGELGAGQLGHLYHLMGNCLVKMKRYDNAIELYMDALDDEYYPNAGSVNVNLGKAYVAKEAYPEAIECFEAAADDETYKTPYKAYAALGKVQLKLGRPTDAGVAYRRAALDESNPDPSRSLVNLGVCFMALNRPHDAVEAYTTALEFDTKRDARNKTYANLGQAYVATGRMKEGVDSFNHALADGTYTLSESASVDYSRAMAILSAEQDPSAGFDQSTGVFSEMPGEEVAVIPPPDDTGFFSISEEEIDTQGRNEIRQERKLKNTGLKIVLVIAIILVLLLGGAAFVYYKGFGYPLQETVIQNMFTDYSNGDDITKYWAEAEAADINNAMACVGKTSDIEINAVERSMMDSTATVTANLPEGGKTRYIITMGRDVIGWKVTNIELVFASQQS